MTTATGLNYGNFARPEESNSVTIGDPVEIVKSVTAQMLPLLENLPRLDIDTGPRIEYEHSELDQYNAVYNEAAALLRPHAGSFSSLSQLQVRKIIDAVKTHYDASQLILSAMLNETDLRFFSSGKDVNALGFRLQDGKILHTTLPTSYDQLGSHAEGGAIINDGTAFSFASYASGGLHINGIYPLPMYVDRFFCAYASGGIAVNLGAVHSFGMMASGGVLINIGKCDYFAYEASGGMQINLGTTGLFGKDTTGGVQLELGTSKKYITQGSRKLGRAHIKKDQKAKTALKDLQSLLSEIEFLKLKPGERPASPSIESFDWISFSKNLQEACGRLEDRLR